MVETPFLQVPCTDAHDRNSGTSSFKTNWAHGNNCIKNVKMGLGYTSQPVTQTQTWPREITRQDGNNKDGGSAIRKTENGFMFLIYWLFAVSDRPSCPHQVLLTVMFTHRSPSQSFLSSYWHRFVLRKQGAVFDLAQHSRIILVVNPEK